MHNGNQISTTSKIENSEIIEPCFVGENALIKNTKIGPYVSIGANTSVEDSVITKTIIQPFYNNFQLQNISYAQIMNSLPDYQ